MRFATMTSRFVSLTGEGKRMEEQIKEVPNCLARELTASGMSEDELRSLLPLLDKFIGVAMDAAQPKE